MNRKNARNHVEGLLFLYNRTAISTNPKTVTRKHQRVVASIWPLLFIELVSHEIPPVSEGN